MIILFYLMRRNSSSRGNQIIILTDIRVVILNFMVKFWVEGFFFPSLLGWIVGFVLGFSL